MIFGMSAPHLVSVVTPAYRAERHVAACIDSVMNQTHHQIEHIVVDDASPDGTWAVIRQYAECDSRIIPLRLMRNSGPAVARNAAITAARGRYIAFLDADDLWLPQKLQRQIAFMQDRHAGLSFSWYERVDEYATRDGRVVHAPAVVRYDDLLKSNHIGCLTAIYDTAVFGKPLMPDVPVHQDWAYWLKLTRSGELAYCVPEVLALYRHGYSATVSSRKIKTFKHKWRVYRELEGIGVFRSLYYLLHLAVRGWLKYRI